MASFNLSTLKSSGKDFMSNAKTPAMMGVLIAGGAIASQKFLNLQTLLKNQDPNSFFIKHQGGIKAIAGITTLAMWKNAPDWAKWLIMGVIVQGAIQETRALLSAVDLPAIGSEEEDKIMQDAARELFQGGMMGITDQYDTAVMGAEDNFDPSAEINQEANTMVMGMGTANEFGFNWAA